MFRMILKARLRSIKMARAPEVVYEVESVISQSIPPISQIFGVKKNPGARANQTGRRFHRWLGHGLGGL